MDQETANRIIDLQAEITALRGAVRMLLHNNYNADDSALAGLDENDPGSMERLMKRMGNEMGAEAGDDLEAMDNFDEGVGDRDGLDSL